MNDDDFDATTSNLNAQLRALHGGWSGNNMATLRGQVMWNGKPVIDDDDGGTAGVREPRHPGPPPPMSGGAMATLEFAS